MPRNRLPRIIKRNWTQRQKEPGETFEETPGYETGTDHPVAHSMIAS
jgi:hypothetical protein